MHGPYPGPTPDRGTTTMKLLRLSLMALLLTVGTAACGSSIVGPDHTPDPGVFTDR